MRAAAIYGTLGALALSVTAVTPASGSPTTPSAPPGIQAGVAEAYGTAQAVRAAAATGIDWKKCPASEHLPAPVACGKVAVPVDYANPEGEKIQLSVSRSQATGKRAERQGPLVYNPGGPGGDGMSFALYGKVLGGMWKKVAARYDMVGYSPRGVGRSAPLSCEDPKRFAQSPNRSPRSPSAGFKRKMIARAAAYAQGCADAQGSRLRHYTTPDNARDLDVIRAALGQKKLNFFGVSYGTYLGSVYATLFPGHVRRLVLDSVVDPSPGKIWYRSNLDQNVAFERRWGDWKKWVAGHSGTYRLGSDAQAVQRSFDGVRDALDRKPAGGKVGSKELVAAYLDTGYADSAWPSHARALAEYRKGNEKPLVKLAAPPSKEEAAEEENGNAVYNAVQCADAPWPRDWRRWDRDNTELAKTAPFNTWDNAWMNLPCAYWKAAPSRALDVGTVPGALPPVLMLAATRDAATPYEGALETQRRLSGASLVTERGAGTHGVAGENKCADQHLEHYLLDGKTPGFQVDCTARPAPKP